MMGNKRSKWSLARASGFAKQALDCQPYTLQNEKYVLYLRSGYNLYFLFYHNEKKTIAILFFGIAV